MCDYGEDDETDVWVFEWIKARKQHHCCACDEPIEPGHVYHSYKALRDGVWSRWIHCARCWYMCKKLWARNDGAAINLELNCGEVWEEPPEDVAALAFMLPEDHQPAVRKAWENPNERKDVMP